MSRIRTLNDALYGCWKSMHVRCYDESYHSYHRYGGRGIKVCERWHDYSNFKLDMGHSYFKGLTVDRINNDGDYSPLNCQWLPAAENTKTLLVDPEKLLQLYEEGCQQKELAKIYNTDQPHISRILARGRKLRAHS